MSGSRRIRGRLGPDRMFPAGRDGFRVEYLVLASGVRLRVVESGPGDGAPVVLLHGWGASVYMYRFLLADLAARGFHAIAIDFRGHGLSDKPTAPGEYRREKLVADVKEALDLLEVRGRFALVGQSMGGAVALELAIDLADRVSRLVLINPAGISPVRVARIVAISRPWLDQYTSHITPRWLVWFLLRSCYGDAGRMRDRDVDEYWAPSQFTGYGRAMRALVREFGWEPLPAARLERLVAPTLLVVGTIDRVIPSSARGAPRLPRVELAVIDGAGHVAHEERPEVVDPMIADFLADPAV